MSIFDVLLIIAGVFMLAMIIANIVVNRHRK